MDREPCGRITPTTGRPCRARRVTGFPSCGLHMTAAEREDRDRKQAGFDAAIAKPAEPACWSWPVADAHHMAAAQCRRSGPREGWLTGMALLEDWQQGRCAVCGNRPRVLAEDHDHATGLVRGLLCRGCNVQEGAGRAALALFERYRRRPPVALLDIEVAYLDPLSGDFAPPQAERGPRPQLL